MICPVCKKNMVIVEHRDIELDYCTTCKGVWFDSGELELLLEAAGITDFRPFLDGILNRTEAVAKEKTRKCPICLKKMKKVAVRENGNVIIDVCRNNDGIWFDHREIENLAEVLQEQTASGEQKSRLVLDFLQEVFRY